MVIQDGQMDFFISHFSEENKNAILTAIVVGNNIVKSLVNRIKKSSEALRNPFLHPRLKSLYGE